MSEINIDNLSTLGADLLADSESFLQELKGDELAGIAGGAQPQPTPPIRYTARETVTPNAGNYTQMGTGADTVTGINTTNNQSTSSLACDCTGMVPVSVPTYQQPTYNPGTPTAPRHRRRYHKWFSR
jgi:hypothetical protein